MDKKSQLLLMERHFEEGDVLMKGGEESHEFFLLKEGEVWVFKDEKKVGVIKGGGIQEFIGEVGAILKTPRIATVVAQTKCIVLAVPASQLENVLAHAPSLGVKLARSLAHKLSDLMANMKSYVT